MSLLTRLNLRENWPLWVAATMLLFSSFYFLLFFVYPLMRGSIETPVIYPLLMFYHSTVSLFIILTLFGLLVTIGWACVALPREHLLIVIVGGFVSTIFLLMNTPIGFIAFLITLLALMVLSSQQQAKRPVAIGLLLLSIVLLFPPALDKLLLNFQHRNTVVSNNHTYNLVQIADSDLGLGCQNNNFIVFVCDSLGVICHLRFTSDVYSECLGYNPLPTQVSLTVDPATDLLTLQLDDQRFPIEP